MGNDVSKPDNEVNTSNPLNVVNPNPSTTTQKPVVTTTQTPVVPTTQNPGSSTTTQNPVNSVPKLKPVYTGPIKTNEEINFDLSKLKRMYEADTNKQQKIKKENHEKALDLVKRGQMDVARIIGAKAIAANNRITSNTLKIAQIEALRDELKYATIESKVRNIMGQVIAIQQQEGGYYYEKYMKYINKKSLI
jgi:hypothetical protein